MADTTGAIIKRIDYDSFGNIISDSNPAFNVPFGFAGGLHDRDTGLVRFGYRDYSPELGRFVAKDPIDFAGGDTNLYAYVSGNVINDIDPLGLARQLPLPPFSDDDLSQLTKEELKKLYDQYRHLPKEREKVRLMQKRKWFRGSKFMRGGSVRRWYR